MSFANLLVTSTVEGQQTGVPTVALGTQWAAVIAKISPGEEACLSHPPKLPASAKLPSTLLDISFLSNYGV